MFTYAKALNLPKYYQFNTMKIVMMTICASHIDSLIIYGHFGGSGGG